MIENFPMICLQYVHDVCFMGEGSPSKPAIHELRAHRPHDNCAIALQTVTILLDRKRTRGHELITYYMERDGMYQVVVLWLVIYRGLKYRNNESFTNQI